MSAAFGQNLPEEEDEVGSQTATFPLLNQLFFSGSDRRRDLPEKQNKEREKEAPPSQKPKSTNS